MNGLTQWNVFGVCAMFVTPSETETRHMKKLYGELFDGHVVPFLELTCLTSPSLSKHEAGTHQFGAQNFQGPLRVLCRMWKSDWSGDLLVADWDDIEICEPISDVHAKRFKASEAAVIPHSGSYRFLCGDGSSPQSGNAVPRHLRRHRLLSDDFDEAEGNIQQVTAIDSDKTEENPHATPTGTGKSPTEDSHTYTNVNFLSTHTH